MRCKIFPVLIWFFGFTCGVLLIIYLRYDHKQLTTAQIQNRSGKTIEKIIIEDDDLQNKYLIERLPDNEDATISIYARGEIGYILNIYFEDDIKIRYGVYAETGYNDRFIVRSDSIEYIPGAY